MLTSLHLQGVGPAPEMRLDCKPRLNLITGDNGLGKTFLLDVAWWALTRTWAGEMVVPAPGVEGRITRGIVKQDGDKPIINAIQFHKQTQQWVADSIGYRNAGLVYFVRVDGSVLCWDPVKEMAESFVYWLGQANVLDGNKGSVYYQFSSEEIWNGKRDREGRHLCNGLIADWVAWQRERNEPFEQLQRVLRHLSESEVFPLRSGKPVRVALNDVRDIPTLVLPYGEVPVTLVSAGMRRIITLAYLLVWTWREHELACEMTGEEPRRHFVLLIDELDAHLHPRWQRVILPALLEVMGSMLDSREVTVQLLATTHAPLVLASAEALFDEKQDAVWSLSMSPEGRVSLEQDPWRRRGDANAWLVSLFGLPEPGSLAAERAMTRAGMVAEKGPAASDDEVMAAERALQAALGDADPFWMRWRWYREQRRKGQP